MGDRALFGARLLLLGLRQDGKGGLWPRRLRVVLGHGRFMPQRYRSRMRGP